MAAQRRMVLVGCAVAGLALIAWLLMDRQPPPLARATAPSHPQTKQLALDAAWRGASAPAAGSSSSEPAPPRAMAQRPRREASADWSKLLVSMSLEDVLTQAESSARPDDRRSAVWAWAQCAAAATEPQAVSRTQAAEFFHGDSSPGPDFIQRTAQSMLASRLRLLEFCGDLQSAPLRAALERVALQSKKETSASSVVLGMRGLSSPSQWTQEQMQAVQLVLSNPQQHPRALDHLLDHVLTSLPGLDARQLNMAEKLRIRSTAYQLLSGDQDPDSVRNVFLCFNQALCGVYHEGDALSPEQQQLMNLAQAVVLAIRTQRWHALGM